MKRNRTCLKILRYRKHHPFVFYFMILYLGGIFIYILIFHLWFADYSKPMPLNEVGDFLAGVFAPIAFLFLYLGYVQQGKELQQNTQALNLQVEELKNSVEQQKELVDATREEIDLSREEIDHQRKIQQIQVQPFFHFKNFIVTDDPEEKSSLLISFTFYNSRATCRDLVLTVVKEARVDYTRIRNHIENPKFYLSSFDVVLGQSEQEYSIPSKRLPANFSVDKIYMQNLELKFEYVDFFGEQHVRSYTWYVRPALEDGKYEVGQLRLVI